jgi:hypothetical protein
MFNRHALKGLGLGLAIPLVLAALAGLVLAPAGQVTANPKAAPAAQPRPMAFAGGPPLVIPAAAFSSDGFAPDKYHFSFSAGAVEGTGSGPGCLKAPVYLPQWAVVNEVFASIYDNDATYNVAVNLQRVDNYTQAVATMASMASTGASTTIQSPSDAAIEGHWITYPQYSYYATTCLYTASTKLYSVRVWYSNPHSVYLPLVRQ